MSKEKQSGKSSWPPGISTDVDDIIYQMPPPGGKPITSKVDITALETASCTGFNLPEEETVIADEGITQGG